MRSSCEADHTRQAKNSSAASGTMPISSSAEGKSPIDSSNVAMDSVTSETTTAASTPARTEGFAAAMIVSVPAIAWAMRSRIGGLNAPLTISVPTIVRDDGPPPLRADAGGTMDVEAIWEKRPATIEEIRWRGAHALDRHPLCRGVEFEIIGMPRTRRSNWTVSLKSVRSDALFEANEIVADIQEAYDLATAARFQDVGD